MHAVHPFGLSSRLAPWPKSSGTPDAETLERANVVRLMRRHGFDDYRELVRRSIDDPEWFWAAAVEDLGIEFAEPWTQVLDASRGPEWTTWFVGGKLNIAWNCVHRWAAERATETAAVFRGEDGARRELSFGELSSQVTKLAEALVRLGVEPGDRVAIYLPMSPEVAVASHACAHIGAVQVPIFSGFAAPAVAQRLADSEAKVAITVESSLRRGREIPMLASLEEATAGSAVPGARRARPVRRAARRLPGRARAARGRLGASVPARVHVRHHRPAEGRAARPGRLSRLDRARGRLPGRRSSRRRHPLRHRHGLDHGPVDGGRRRRDGRDDRVRGGRSRLAGRPALAARGRGARLDPRLLPHAHPGADPARRAAAGSLVAPHHRHDRRAVEPRSVPLAVRAGRRRTLPDHQLLGRDRGRRVLPVAHARDPDQGVLGRRAHARAWPWTSSTTTGTRSWGPARWASSSAASRSPA